MSNHTTLIFLKKKNMKLNISNNTLKGCCGRVLNNPDSNAGNPGLAGTQLKPTLYDRDVLWLDGVVAG